MSTSKRISFPGAHLASESEHINAHALGVTLASTHEADMERFEHIEKERLMERHAAAVNILNTEIEGLKRRAGVLAEQIRRHGKREDKLMLALGALAMLVAYFYLRDYGCGVPLWTRNWVW